MTHQKSVNENNTNIKRREAETTNHWHVAGNLTWDFVLFFFCLKGFLNFGFTFIVTFFD